MSVDDEMPADVSTGTDRRTALKKAAIAAGVVAWTTPAVQAVTPRPAHAQQVTNCVPVLTATAQATGPTCECVSAPSKSCCSDNTYFITVTATCGASCPGKAGVTVTAISGDPKPGCKDGIFFRDLLCTGGTAQITITGSVTCPDGKVFPVNSLVTATCSDCLVPTTLTADSNLFEEPSLDPPPETTPTETTIGGGDPPAAESPPANESPPTSTSPPAAQSPPSSPTGGGGSDSGG